jgi:hypothetical protein
LARLNPVAFQFKCVTCGETHTGMPTFGADAPLSYFGIPNDERDHRCALGSDDCIIDDKWFFVRGCLEIPVRGEAEPFVWGVWVSLSPTTPEIPQNDGRTLARAWHVRTGGSV